MAESSVAEVAELFKKIGGEFIEPPSVLAEKLKKIKAFVFDWDGVFNSGIKGVEISTGFSEADAMALHILRYAYWKITGSVPVIAIVTAQKNDSSVRFAEREHLTHVFFNYKDKYLPIQILKQNYGLEQENIATAFDDIIDYPLAMSSNVRFLIRRKSSPLFHKYWTESKLCDYVTGSETPEHPVREIAELVIGLLGIYNEVVISRFRDKDTYHKYWLERNAVKTTVIENSL
jgi:3-deoxy-D-manno-octulosonate 8-phosphate phosphatase (KDO 8-P phosphatase)